MFVGEVTTSSSHEPEFSEKEDDEWILVDFIGKAYATINCHKKWHPANYVSDNNLKYS